MERTKKLARLAGLLILIGIFLAIVGKWITLTNSPAEAASLNELCPTATATATPQPTSTFPPLAAVSDQPTSQSTASPCSYLPFIQYHDGTPRPTICPSPTPEASPTIRVTTTSPPLQANAVSASFPCVTVTPFPTHISPTAPP